MKTNEFLESIKAIESRSPEALRLAAIYGKDVTQIGHEYWFVEKLTEVLKDTETRRSLAQVSSPNLVVVEQFSA
ncbi:MAG: hypothetical protein H6617_03030 [Bdellovibrionaceae bacterium]|nr:hypothetical protein [Bdellovibrionales bacterium]MCB9253633.1 hypothetical protein [Pseudobdellovibrionaceae bacterium]